MKKLVSVLICVLLIAGSVIPAFGLEKSIEPISDISGIRNAGPSIEISHQGEKARVFYGSGGILIVTDKETQHIGTNFDVVKLVDAGDINGDGFTDFFTYQNAPNYTEQLAAISGKDGAVISAIALTRDGYDQSLGYVQTNSYIQHLLAAEDGNIIVLYDYSLVKIDPKSGEILFKTDFDNNVWRAVSCGDLNGDGSEDYAVSGQSNLVAITDGASGEILREYHPNEDKEISPYWTDDIKVNAVFNIWDLYFDGKLLYATSETGQLFTIDLQSDEISSVDIGAVSEDELNQELSNNNIHYNLGYRYTETGVTHWAYMGYRIADVKDGYLLIDCLMGAPDSAVSYKDTMLPSAVALYNTQSGEVENIISTNNLNVLYHKTCFIDYEGTPCIAVANSLRENALAIAYYDYSGNIAYQKEAAIGFVDQMNSGFEFSACDEGLRVEGFGAGSAVLSPDLKTATYAYDKMSTAFLASKDDGIYVTFSSNDKKIKIVKYSLDLKEELWSFEAPSDFENKGFEFIRADRDYNGDGTDDILAIVNRYNDEGENEASKYVVLSGTDGEEIFNNFVKTDEYYDYDKKQRVTVYLKSQTVDTVRDLDYDGTPELLCDTSVLSSRSKRVMGDLYGGIDTNGVMLAVGDANGDGVTDYLVIGDNETRLYHSFISSAWGMASLEYRKTATAIANDKTLEPMTTSGLIGDIDNDGVSELVMLGKNESNFYVFCVYNGKTLEKMYELCDYGLNDDGESFTALTTDFNGDGFNELYGCDNWMYGIYDGKTGELLMNTSGNAPKGDVYVTRGGTVMASSTAYDEDPYNSGYHPDYILKFNRLEEQPNFVVLNDTNGDKNPDMAFIQQSNDEETWERITRLMAIGGGSFEEIGEIKLPSSRETEQISQVIKVEGSDRYVALIGDGTLGVVDLETKGLLATYYTKAKSAMQEKSGNIVISADDGNLYKLNLDKSFEIQTEVPEQLDDYLLHLAWTPKHDLSVMTIKDNGEAVYSGNAKEIDLKLLSGAHSIELSMNDGQGKVYTESYRVDVQKTNANYIWVAAICGVALLLSLFFGVFRRVRIANKFKFKEAAK